MVSARWIVGACIGVLAATMPSGQALAGIITAIDVSPGIIDGSTATRTVTFDGSEPGYGSGVITKLTVSIGFGKGSDGIRPEYNQMAFRLANPTGSIIVDLINLNDFGRGFGAFLGILTFDDDAPFVVNVLPNFLFPGTYRPTESTPNNFLSSFAGGTAAGDWTLTIEDSATGAPIAFGGFSITIETVAAPEPSALALAGVGIAALAGSGWRRHRRRRTAAA